MARVTSLFSRIAGVLLRRRGDRPRPPRGRLARLIYSAAYTGKRRRAALRSVTLSDVSEAVEEAFAPEVIRCIIGSSSSVVVTAEPTDEQVTDCLCPDGRRYEFDCRRRSIVVEYQGRRVRLTFVDAG